MNLRPTETGATLSTANIVNNLNLPTSNDNAILVIDAPVAKRAVYIAYTVRGTGSQYNSTIFNVTPYVARLSARPHRTPTPFLTPPPPIATT